MDRYTPTYFSQIFKEKFEQTKYESPRGVANYQWEGLNSNTKGPGPRTTANLNPCACIWQEKFDNNLCR